MPLEAPFDNPPYRHRRVAVPVAPDTSRQSLRPPGRECLAAAPNALRPNARLAAATIPACPIVSSSAHPRASEDPIPVRFPARCLGGLRGTTAPGESEPGVPLILALTNGRLSA